MILLDSTQKEAIKKYLKELLESKDDYMQCTNCHGTGLANFEFFSSGGHWDGLHYCARCFGYGKLRERDMNNKGLDSFMFEHVKGGK